VIFDVSIYYIVSEPVITEWRGEDGGTGVLFIHKEKENI
jgi:hypothetical protein